MPAIEGRPRPAPIATSKPFWDALKEEKVRLQRCGDCEAWVYYPRRRCPSCLSAALEWRQVSGRGRIYSWTIGRQATHPAFGADVPQLLAMVELDEGVRLTTTIVNAEPTDLVVGRLVEPVFEHGEDGMTLLQFQPVAGSG